MTSPYVAPFWSYRLAGDTGVYTNWLTRQSASAPAAWLGILESVYRGTVDASMTATTEWARELGILFDSRQEADAWLDGHERRWLKEYPSIEQVELTNRCPYTCGMCPRTESMDRGLGDMSLDLFASIVRQISGSQDYVALHHFGETLVYPRLAEAVALARSHGVLTGISCNPPSLAPALAERLLRAGISNIVLSLDSLDRDVYRQIRGVAARLDRADQHLRALVRLRDAGDYETGITLQMINMRANHAEADRFLEYCAEVGVDRGVVVRLGRWDFDDARLGVLGEFSTPGYDGYCSRPWRSVAVLWDGRVVPCCHDYNGDTVLGDLSAQSVAEMWSSAAAVRFRTRNRESSLCARCAFSRSSRERQRETEGFLPFHRERHSGGARREWINPKALGRRDTRHLFDDFDVLVS